MKFIQVKKVISRDFLENIPDNYDVKKLVESQIAELFTRELLKNNELEISATDEYEGTAFSCSQYIMNKQTFSNLVIALNTLKFSTSNILIRNEIDNILKILNV